MYSMLKCIIIGIALGCLFIMLKNPMTTISNSYLDILHSNSNSYSYAIKQSAPSVVNIYIENKLDYSTYKNTNHFNSNILNSASGIIVDAKGYILTNYHVIMNSNQSTTNIYVQLRDGTKYQAKVVGYDKRTDLAVLKIEPLNDLPVIKVNANATPHLGDIVLAIGNPLNLGQTITHGIISAVGRTGSGVTNLNTIDLTPGLQEFIQTDAPINDGNSGGALINTSGELIGINTATLNSEIGANGISFAIPQKLAYKIMNDLILHGRVIRGYLGITGSDIENNNLSINVNHGFVINDVNQTGPSAGILKHNDVITHINGIEVLNINHAMEIIADSAPGAAVKFTLIRNNKVMETEVYVGEQPQS